MKEKGENSHNLLVPFAQGKHKQEKVVRFDFLYEDLSIISSSILLPDLECISSLILPWIPRQLTVTRDRSTSYMHGCGMKGKKTRGGFVRGM